MGQASLRAAPWLAFGAALCALAAHADEPIQSSQRQGYAFEYPRVLAQQQLFGIAHGIALLATACRFRPGAGPETELAYAAWRARQQGAIDGARSDLGVYYLGDAGVAAPVVAQHLHLREALDYAPDSAELAAACATLPAALERPRYDLVARLRLEEMMARIVAATVVEARERHCRGKLPAAARKLLRVRYHLWREINDPLLDQDGATLERDWPAEAPAATFAAWLAGLRRDTRAGGNETSCALFSEALKRPESALRNVFRMPPPLRRPNPK